MKGGLPIGKPPFSIILNLTYFINIKIEYILKIMYFLLVCVIDNH